MCRASKVSFLYEYFGYAMSHVIHIDDGTERHFYKSVCGKYSSGTVEPVKRGASDSCVTRDYPYMQDPGLNWCQECLARDNLYVLAEIPL